MKIEKHSVVVRGITQRDNKILLCRAVNKENFFLIGGHLLKDEDPIQALQREVLEETGEKILNIKKVCDFANSYFEGGATIHEKNIVFRFDFEPESFLHPQSLEKHIEFIWMDEEETKNITVLPNSIISLINGGVY